MGPGRRNGSGRHAGDHYSAASPAQKDRRGQGHAAHGQRHGPGAGVGGRKDELKNGGCGPMSAG